VCNQQSLDAWIQVDSNMFFFQDKKGIVWQLLRTPYKEIPVCKINFSKEIARIYND